MKGVVPVVKVNVQQEIKTVSVGHPEKKRDTIMTLVG